MTREENWIAEISPVPRFWQIAAPAALDLLNIYWGQKIYSKLVRAFKRIEKELWTKKGLEKLVHCESTSDISFQKYSHGPI